MTCKLSSLLALFQGPVWHRYVLETGHENRPLRTSSQSQTEAWRSRPFLLHPKTQPPTNLTQQEESCPKFPNVGPPLRVRKNRWTRQFIEQTQYRTPGSRSTPRRARSRWRRRSTTRAPASTSSRWRHPTAPIARRPPSPSTCSTSTTTRRASHVTTTRE